jgi:mannose-6-phosphate isomerase
MNTPLRLRPIFRNYLWGGRRLETMLGKSLGEGENYAESWEVVDHGKDQSIVVAGPASGQTLHQLVERQGQQLFGRHHPQRQFPLLFKFLDCNRTLSVQVHPNDQQAAQLDPPDLGKTEAWLVLAADPGSKLFAGLLPGVTHDDLAAALEFGTCEEMLHQFEPSVGDCVFIEAGTVHALGAGLVIAEIQQTSDTTFRLFDFNRVDADGKPRPLHIEQSLATIDYDRGPISAVAPAATDDPGRERLVDCDKFVLDRCTLEGPCTIGGDDRFHLLISVEGSVEIEDDPSGDPLSPGQTCLVPAAAGALGLTPQGRAVVLDIYLP